MKQLQLGKLTVRVTGGTDGDGGGDGPMVVLLHGFGAAGTDLVPLARELAVPAGTRFAFPEAPLSLPAQLGGGDGRAWWMIDVMGMQLAMLQGKVEGLMDKMAVGLPAANELVAGMLDALTGQYDIDPEKLVLGGFSQGAMLALDVALRSPRKLAGLVLMSCSFLSPQQWPALMERREGLPVLQSHGQQDPLLPYVLAEQLRDAMVGAGMPVTWVPFSGGHGIAPMVLDALSDFVNFRSERGLRNSLTSPKG